MVDTGASINVMDKETFAKLPPNTLEKTTIRAFAYDNDKPVTFIGKFDTPVETRKRYAIATFYVVNHRDRRTRELARSRDSGQQSKFKMVA